MVCLYTDEATKETMKAPQVGAYWGAMVSISAVILNATMWAEMFQHSAACLSGAKITRYDSIWDNRTDLPERKKETALSKVDILFFLGQ